MFTVVDATVEELPSDTPGVTRTKFHLAGRPHVTAASGTAAARMQRAEQTDTLSNKLDYLADKSAKTTVLVRTRNGDVQAREGTLFRNGDSIGLVNKGDRSGKGIWLVDPRKPTGLQVLGVEQGYGRQEALADRYWGHVEKVPQTEPATFDDLPVVEGYDEPPSQVAAVYVFTHPGFDDSQDGRGSLFFVTDFQPGDGGSGPDGQGVVNGYGVYSPDSGLESEHGSMYASQLARWGGRVTGYRPGAHTFRDVMDLAKVADAYGDGDIEQVWESVRDASN